MPHLAFRMPRDVIRAAAFVCLLALPLAARAQDTFDIYFIDVEGGGATLFVAPGGDSLLIDTGNGGANASRDAQRILAAVQDAGLTQIDHLITTHWHGDHFGGLAEVARRIPIRHFIDHGPSVDAEGAGPDFVNGAYAALYGAATRTVAAPGDQFALDEIAVTVLTSAKQVIESPVSGGGAANPHCEAFVPQPEDTGENAQSVGIVAEFGAFRVVHMGDLTANTEFALMCPGNPIGTADLFVVSHHGQPSSNSEALVHAVAPRVAIMNNGTRKGGQPDAMRVLHTSPGLEDLWQLHFSQLSGQEFTVPGMFIANGVDDPLTAMPVAPLVNPGRGAGIAPAPVHNGEANWIKVSAASDGSFTVSNTRNAFSKAYR